MFAKTLLLVLLACFVHTSGRKILRDDSPACTDPRVSQRADQCPSGYCCVRDEFLPTYVYCKKIGLLGDNCTTRQTESACPCAVGLYCKANIESSMFKSLYGRCMNVTKSPHENHVPQVGR